MFRKKSKPAVKADEWVNNLLFMLPGDEEDERTRVNVIWLDKNFQMVESIICAYDDNFRADYIANDWHEIFDNCQDATKRSGSIISLVVNKDIYKAIEVKDALNRTIAFKTQLAHISSVFSNKKVWKDSVTNTLGNVHRDSITDYQLATFVGEAYTEPMI